MPIEGSPEARAQQAARKAAMPDVNDPVFDAFYTKAKPFSLLTLEKFYSLYGAIHYVCDRRVQGDIIECGVWKGGAMILYATGLPLIGFLTPAFWILKMRLTSQFWSRPQDMVTGVSLTV